MNRRPRGTVPRIDIVVPESWHAIYAVVKRIPKGKVASYGQVALLAGLPRAARLAGTALFHGPPELVSKIPWQRVVNAAGRISYSEARNGSDHRQRELLEKEGIEFSAAGVIRMSKYGWDGK
ncbi:MGMT family protein [bacterium]|nr:MGMT family protein [bacterium]